MLGRETEKEADRVEDLLRAEAARAVPAPSGDLVGQTLARVRGWVLVSDLLRFFALEGLWKRQNAGDRGAESARARQDQ